MSFQRFLAVAVFMATTVLSTPLERRAALPILLSNDDGWAEANIRELYKEAKAAGYNVLLSAPAENKSGTGSLSTTPKPLTSPGQFNSIPAGSPAVGHDLSDDHIWYVNAYPADAVTYALANLTTPYLGAAPALVLTGPNVGSNLGIATLFSGTVGAAAAAGLPAVAFSGASGAPRPHTVLPAEDYAVVYAGAALRLAAALAAAGPPYLPAGVALNVNFPAAGAGTACVAAGDVVFVLSRVYSALGLPVDVETCGSKALPTESTVVGTKGCYASVSVFETASKLDAGEAKQAVVLARLAGLLQCLPS